MRLPKESYFKLYMTTDVSRIDSSHLLFQFWEFDIQLIY